MFLYILIFGIRWPSCCQTNSALTRGL